MLIMTSGGLFSKSSSPRVKPSFWYTTLTFYGDFVKMCEDFAPNFGDKRTGCCITTTHILTLFSPGNFYRKQNDCRPHRPNFSLFPRLNIKLRGRHFDTPSENTTSRMNLQNGASCGSDVDSDTGQYSKFRA
jgi:hypothetical protein